MLYPTTLSVAPQDWIENLARIFRFILVFYAPVMSFDYPFGFVLVVGERVSTYTHVLFIFSSPPSYEPSKHIITVINSYSEVYLG